jgi:magnesium and cobalt transporter
VLEESHEPANQQEQETRNILKNVLNFSEMTVADIMVPRSDIIAINYSAPIEQLNDLLMKDKHTRIPIYRGSLDDMVGFIHVKDIVGSIAASKPIYMDEVLRRILFVPTSMPITTLLRNMKQSRVHIAIVVDEYGATTGLATLEDVVEEIVGNIEDEHDEESGSNIMQIGSGRFEVLGKTELREVCQRLHIAEEALPEHDQDTIGGIALSLFGYIPHIGERTNWKMPQAGIELTIEVLDADMRRIRKLMVTRNNLAIEEV